MQRGKMIVSCVMVLGGFGMALPAQLPNFDKLSAADRTVFQQRFAKEVWPLMQHNGKDGCVGCHAGKQVTALHLTGDVAKDFPKMLRDGFLLPDDAGSLLGHVTEKDPKRHMPLGNRTPWTDAEIKVLRDLVIDLDAKQKK